MITLYIFIGLFVMVLLYDVFAKRHSLRRAYPVFGRFRWLSEWMRNKIVQYFVESDTNGKPFSREERSNVYQLSKNGRHNNNRYPESEKINTIPFGTKLDPYGTVSNDFIRHSMFPKEVGEVKIPRVLIGDENIKQYQLSRINVSAMSFGSISSNAIEALCEGAKLNNFAVNTGEGGISEYHLKSGADLIWQIGTGYFGVRDDNGNFSKEKFIQTAELTQVKMIEFKLSQGAKPAKGGILPSKKNTKEISEIRGVEPNTDVISPSKHSLFSTHTEMLKTIDNLRKLVEKPIGIKLCVGREYELKDLISTMSEMGILVDFITIDGSEGGTGASPLDYTNHVGLPLLDALTLTRKLLNRYDLKSIKVIASGKIISSFTVLRAIALGADAVNIARGFMFALGCIQALECNKNTCPTGIATHNPWLKRSLVISEKKNRVANFHDGLYLRMKQLLASMGYTNINQLKPSDINYRDKDGELKDYLTKKLKA